MSLEISIRDEKDLVERSHVQLGLKYGEYRETLRYDFFHSCAYCTMSEYEASGIRFTIDHYEPQISSPNLIDEYTNLMWAVTPVTRLRVREFNRPRRVSPVIGFSGPTKITLATILPHRKTRLGHSRIRDIIPSTG